MINEQLYLLLINFSGDTIYSNFIRLFIMHTKNRTCRFIRIIWMRYFASCIFRGAPHRPPHLSIPFRKGWVSRLARCSLPHPCRRSTYRRIPVPPRCSVAWATDGIVIWQTHRARPPEAAKPRLYIRTNPRQTRREPTFPII